ncbi:MAG TPA: Holliday junction resolvase RuvX [Thermoanaerobaculia bacterium]|nr:Holliday junction resolvase RuvX [Thermoanaerobaculia bacterium]
MRYLGIDFGERHIGLAVCDDDERVAVALDTVTRSSDRQAIDAVLAVADRETAGGIVVGEPLRLDGTRGDAALRSHSFAAKLGAATRRPIVLHDEALTSYEAQARLREAGATKRRRKAAIHALAAQILLQDWLDRRRGRCGSLATDRRRI